MPLPSPAQPTQTTSATVNNPLVLTGAVSAMVPSLAMALLILRVSAVPALLVVAQSVISWVAEASRYVEQLRSIALADMA
jgi:hypothetical protein